MLYLKEFILALSVLSFSFGVYAQDADLQQESTENSNLSKIHTSATKKTKSAEIKPEFAAVPFFFSSENLSTAFGGAGVVKHAGQVQSSVFGVGLYTTNDSWVTYVGINDFQLPSQLAPQWLFSIEHYQAFYKEGNYFIPNKNISPMSSTKRIITQGDESFTRLHFEYVLPIAKGINGAAASMMPSKQNISWNPLNSGVSKIRFTPFWQSQNLLDYDFESSSTKGLELLLDWDNRDNGKNSTKGGQSSLKLRHGLSSDGEPSWNTWQFEQSAFFSIGRNDLFRQQILAANFYLADTPNWNEKNSEHQYHRPPSYAGITLGGYERLRGYSSRQFSGRSAVLYTLEYRVQPYWQPLQKWPVFDLYDVPWWQWVVFAEMGKVSDEFSMSALHDDMKWSVGGGVRFEVESVVVRAELGVSQESNQFWVMVSQPF